jgi:transcriptional regulator with XRE-family HTH domain
MRHAGLELAVLRFRMGVLQYRVAAHLGVSPQYISMVERGRKPIPAGFSERYRRALDELCQQPRARELRK